MNSNTDNLIALNVLKKYGIVPDEFKLIQSGTIKAVWKLSTQGKQLCLKRLNKSYEKALFSVNAQIYIKASGGKVAGVIKSPSGESIVNYNDELFVLYEWIDGKDMYFDEARDLLEAVGGLAAFHIAAKGYIPPPGSEVSTKLGKWPSQYESMQKKLAVWKEEAAKLPDQPQNTSYLKYADSMISLAAEAREMLSKSHYAEYSKEGSPYVVLCHQDFGKGNCLSTPEGVYILDLDGVTYDLPARDLRKIIGKNAENKGQWQAKSIDGIIRRYSEINPLDEKEIEILYIDLLFPHWFFGLVKNKFQKGKSIKPSEIEKIAKLEESKALLIKAMDKRSD